MCSSDLFSAISAQVLSLVLLFLGIAACLAGAKSGSSSAAFADSGWIPYSEAALEKALDEKRPVFVDFTAAWCLTCQVNRKLVLERESVQKFFQEKGVVLLLGDWTNRDPGITKALEQQGRIGVPLYLVYPAGARQARVLPQILTEGILRSSF